MARSEIRSSLEHFVIGAKIIMKERISGGCFLRLPRRLRSRRCHNQEGPGGINSLRLRLFIHNDAHHHREIHGAGHLDSGVVLVLLNLGAEIHQPVGEVGPHDGPAVASPVGVILLDVVRILICCVQDNNLTMKRYYILLGLIPIDLNDKE